MEEDLFPSAMSMSTRSELEEERRLCGVNKSRTPGLFDLCTVALPLGKLTDSEPSCL
jgi:DNA helicase-2/ATP-dependent DNA helicase PcrA